MLRFLLFFLAATTLASAATPPSSVPPLLVPNHGQAPDQTHFTLRTARHHVAFQDSQLTWTTPGTAAAVVHTFPGSDPNTTPVAGEPSGPKVNLLLGADPAAWHTGLAAVDTLTYPSLYPGIDLVYLTDRSTLKREFHVAPHRDPSVIQLAFDGVDRLEISPHGHLLLHTASGTLQEDAPIAWQTHPGGRRSPVDAAFVLTSPTTAAFELGPHDPDLPLVIDPPVRLVATFGGAGDDTAFGLVSTPTNYYIAGVSNSSDFPVTDGTTYAGDTDGTGDMVVAALDLDGNITWATYVGGSGTDFANGIAIANDHTGLTVSGWTTSGASFPSLNPIPELTPGAKSDCAVLQFDLAGNLTSASRFGGSEDDQFSAVATHASGSFPNPFVPGTVAFCGFTNSTDFPFPAANPGSADTTKSATTDTDALFVVINPDRTPRVASYHGRITGKNEIALGISRCGFDEFAVTGWTDDANFYKGPFDRGNGGKEMFLTCMRDSDAVRRYSRIRGGSGDDIGQGVAFGFSGALVVVGQTTSTDYPTTGNTIPQATHGGGTTDGFIHLYNRSSTTSGAAGTYWGGSGEDNLRAVAADPNGYIHFAGSTTSTDLRTVDPSQAAYGGGDTDAVLGTLSVSASSRSITERFVTYAGTDNTEGFTAVAPLAELPPAFNFEPYFPVAAGGARPTPAGSPAVAKKKSKGAKNITFPTLFSEQCALFVSGPEKTPPPNADLGVTINAFRDTVPPDIGTSKPWEVTVEITNHSDIAATNVTAMLFTRGVGCGMYEPLQGPDIPSLSNIAEVHKVHELFPGQFFGATITFPTIPAGGSVRFGVKLYVDENGGSPPFSVQGLEADEPDLNQENNNVAIRWVNGETVDADDPAHNVTAASLPLINATTPASIPSLSPQVLDPVSLGEGALTFSLPLFELGGPLPLGATLHHSPGIPRSYFQFTDLDPNLLPQHFWLDPYAVLSPYAELADGEFYTTVQLAGGTFLTFRRQPDTSWALHTGPLQVGARTLPAADSPVPYQLLETTERMWLVDPQRHLVYEFALQLGPTILVAVHDRNGNRLDFNYQGLSRVPTSITDGLGRMLDLTYRPGPTAGSDVLASIADQTGRTWTFGYDENAADNFSLLTLRSLTDPENGTTTFAYGNSPTLPHAVTAYTLPENNTPHTTAYARQEWGGVSGTRVSSQTTADGHTTNFAYAPGSRGVDITTPDSAIVNFGFVGPNLPASEFTDPEGNTSTFNHNSSNQLTSSEHPATGTTNFTYHAATGFPASVTDTLGQTTAFTFSPAPPLNFQAQFIADNIDVVFHDLTRIDLSDGTHIRLVFDASGNLVELVDRAGQAATFTVNGRGQRLTATAATGATASFDYNADGTLATSTTSATGVTTYGYDAKKRLVSVSPPVPAGQPADTATVHYDDLDRATSTTDAESRTTTTTYDANGNPTAVTDGRANTATATYDDQDRPATVTGRGNHTSSVNYNPMSRPATHTSPGGVVTTTTQDSHGRTATTTRGTSTWTSAHDTLQRTSFTSSPLGNSGSVVVDRQGRPVSLEDAAGAVTSFKLDRFGRPITVVERLGSEEELTYDLYGNLSGTALRDGFGNLLGASAFTLAADGRPTAFTDLNGRSWLVDITPEGRLGSFTDPLGNVTGHAFDLRGRTSAIDHADGRTTTIGYDRTGQVTSMLGSDGAGVVCTYDANAQCSSIGGYTFTRDSRGNITTSTFAGVTYGATYDPDNRLGSLTYNNGALTVTYTYDPVTGLLATVGDSLTGALLTLSYDADFRLVDIDRSNGVDTTIEYDDRGQCTRVADGSVSEVRMAYDAGGRLTGRDLTAPVTPSGLLPESLTSFIHDAASQVSSPGYSYSACGQRTTSAGTTCTYDTRNRMTSCGTSTFGYCALDCPVSTTTPAGTTLFQHFPAVPRNPLVASFDTSTDNPLSYFIYSPTGDLLYNIDLTGPAPEPCFYHFDQTGSTLAITDSTGAVTDAYAYSPFGKLLAHQGSSTQPFTFWAQHGVRSLGPFYVVDRRCFDPETASCLTRDNNTPTTCQLAYPNNYILCNNQPHATTLATGPGGNHPKFNYANLSAVLRNPWGSDGGAPTGPPVPGSPEETREFEGWLRQLDLMGSMNRHQVHLLEYIKKPREELLASFRRGWATTGRSPLEDFITRPNATAAPVLRVPAFVTPTTGKPVLSTKPSGAPFDRMVVSPGSSLFSLTSGANRFQSDWSPTGSTTPAPLDRTDAGGFGIPGALQQQCVQDTGGTGAPSVGVIHRDIAARLSTNFCTTGFQVLTPPSTFGAGRCTECPTGSTSKTYRGSIQDALGPTGGISPPATGTGSGRTYEPPAFYNQL